MARRQHGKDGNHDTIVNALKSVGASIVDSAGVGDGFPDLIVGYRGANYLIEIKDGRLVQSRRRLRPDQAKFHDTWGGQLVTVINPMEALVAIGAIAGPVVPRGERDEPVIGSRLQEIEARR